MPNVLNSTTKHWQFVNLNEVLISLESGSRPKGGVKNIKEGIPSIGAEHLDSNGGFNFQNTKYVPMQFAKNMQRGRLMHNDILIVKDGATTGRVSFVDKNFPFDEAYVNEHVFICRPSSSINSRFLFWFLWSDQGRANILQNFKGTAQGGINTLFANNCIIPLPPINEQNVIAEKLDEVFISLKNVRKVINLIPNQIVNATQKILSAAVNGQLTAKWRKAEKLKKNWTTNNLETFINSIESGKSVKCFERPPIEDEVGIVKVSSVSWGEFLEEESKTITHSKFINDKYFIHKDDFLMSRANTTELVGSCVIVRKITKRLMLSDKILRLKFNGINKEWVLLYLKSSEGRNQIEEMASGSQQHMKNISQGKIKNIMISVPSTKEQQMIINIANNLFGKIDKIGEKNAKLRVSLNLSQRQILSSAFDGKLIANNVKNNSTPISLNEITAEKDKYQEEQIKLRVMSKSQNGTVSSKKTKTLSSIILNELKDNTFAFSDIKKYFNLSEYDNLKEEFVSLIKSEKISMKYDEGSKTYNFTLNQ